VIPFVFGIVFVFASLMGVSLWLEPAFRWIERADAAVLLARSVLAPALAAWIVAELINAVRPRRLFDRRVATMVARGVAGLCAGVIGAAATALVLAVAEGYVHEIVVLSSTGAMAAASVLLPLRRVRPGECIHCRYDLRNQPPPGQPGWGICPECGAPVIPGQTENRTCAVA
jgi:hypothetical protein